MEKDETTELSKKLETIEAELQKFITKAQDETGKAGTASAETKSAVEKLSEEAKAVIKRIDALEKDALKRLPGGGPSQTYIFRGDGTVISGDIGDTVMSHQQYKHFSEGGYKSSGKIPISGFKAAILNTGSTLTQPDRIGGIHAAPRRALRIRNLFRSIPCGSNTVEFVRRSTHTNAAAPQKGEGTAKPESSIDFSTVKRDVQTLAHWIPVSNQALSDAPMLNDFLNFQMIYFLLVAEEKQLLSGDGTGNNLLGVITESDAYDPSANEAGDTMLDTIRRGKSQVALADYMPDFVVCHPSDWAKIDLIKTTVDTGGDYIASSPRRNGGVWGLQEVESTAIDEGYFLIGDSTQAMIFDRQQASVEISREHSDFFIKNMSAVLAEERLAFGVFDKAAFRYGAFIEED